MVMPATQVDVIMGIQGLSQMLNKVLAPYDAESTASRPENSDLFFGSLAGLRQLAGRDVCLLDGSTRFYGPYGKDGAMGMAKPEVSDVVLVGTICSHTHGGF